MRACMWCMTRMLSTTPTISPDESLTGEVCMHIGVSDPSFPKSLILKWAIVSFFSRHSSRGQGSPHSSHRTRSLHRMPEDFSVSVSKSFDAEELIDMTFLSFDMTTSASAMPSMSSRYPMGLPSSIDHLAEAPCFPVLSCQRKEHAAVHCATKPSAFATCNNLFHTFPCIGTKLSRRTLISPDRGGM